MGLNTGIFYEDSKIIPRTEPQSLSAERELGITLYKILSCIHTGKLTVRTPRGSEYTFGKADSALKARWLIHDKKLLTRILYNPSLGLGESYMQGAWDIEHDRLDKFFGIILENRLWSLVQENTALRLLISLRRILESPIRLSARISNVKHHYDLSNQFYELMLDEGMTYSCGYQLSRDDSLHKMQQQKYELISRKLGLERGGSLLDVGCGWGAMLEFASDKFPELNALGLTLSTNQLEYANQRLKKKHLDIRAKALYQDFFNTAGTYDFFVSIGMFEHVGKSNYAQYMRKAAQLLKPEGRGLLHTIAVSDPPSVPIDPWTDKYIFPGYRLPRLQELVTTMEKAGLVVQHVENLKPHYAKTLRKWLENVQQNRRAISLLDPRFDTRFFRMWSYYLQGAEASFLHGSSQVYQLLFQHS